MKKFDIICAGELLGDLIGSVNSSKSHQGKFELFAGGSPANLANNLSYLGNKVALIGSVGNDDVGSLLINQLKESGVIRSFVKTRDLPTSMILVSKSKTTATFEAYRAADYQITLGQLKIEKVQLAKIFHTTCFGLSKQPARSSILACADAVSEAGGQLSIDMNYAGKIWPKRKKAKRIIEEYIGKNALLKLSDVDYERLYGHTIKRPESVIDYFLKLGAKEVCLTLGANGVWVADKDNESFLPSNPIEIVDTTGAGDAFWSGYLTAWNKGKSILDCAKVGRAIAEIKLQQFGSIRKKINIEKLG